MSARRLPPDGPDRDPYRLTTPDGHAVSSVPHPDGPRYGRLVRVDVRPRTGPDGRSRYERVLDDARRDPRVDVVVRALLLRAVGWREDDVPRADVDALLAATLRSSAAPSYVFAAVRLLAELDARVAREHPVDLEYRGDGDDGGSGLVVATVLTEDERWVTATLGRHDDPGGPDDGRHVVVLAVGARPDDDVLTRDDAERLGHALLRLVAVADDRDAEERRRAATRAAAVDEVAEELP